MIPLHLVLKVNMTNSSSSEPLPDRLHRFFPPGTKVNCWDLEAVVTKSIHPGRTGQVKFQGTWWSAKCRQEASLVLNTTVYVVDVEGMVLVVQSTPLIDLTTHYPNSEQ